MGISPTESFIILYHEDMDAARAFYEGLLGLEVRQVVYEWFISYLVIAKHEKTLCISTSPDECKQ
ncbi:MAG: hypothetical protein A2Z71_08100 [Chloroflexi bacterium RBG_13_50_21]|nr:MAG: hypothetical protein A2Z71_08100 [Chloroflexi bacterium RBG_13_50_21]